MGFQGDKIVALIDADYYNSLLIKPVLMSSKILKFFDIRFKVNDSFPREAMNMIKPEIAKIIK